MVDQNFKSFFSLCKKKIKCNIPKYLNKEGYFKICDPEGNKRINTINDELYCFKTKGLSELASH